ncbi:MAG: hypothetical protein KC445_15650 [Anaerolineales bacterium]|nr:hypothetical protein [Anaerolineales bacterium]
MSVQLIQQYHAQVAKIIRYGGSRNESREVREFREAFAGDIPALGEMLREAIREQFNTYRFRDYKEQVTDLLARVCTVSVETMRIIHQMPEGDG